MKQWILALVLALSLAFAGTLPEDPRFDQPVTIQTSPQGDPLEVVLAALARAVDLTPVIKLPKELAQTRVRLNVENKPFRKLWDVVIKVYGEGKLDYALLDDGILLVAPPEVIAKAQGQAAPPEEKTFVREFLEIKYLDPAEAAKILAQEIPDIAVTQVPNQRILIVRGPAERIQEAKELLAKIDVPATPEEEKAEGEEAAIVRRFLTVRYLDPQNVINFLKKEVPGVEVTQVPGQKVLVVRGPEDKIAEVEQILAQIDVPPEQGPPIYQRTFQLSNARASELAKVLSEALKAKGVATTGEDGKITVEGGAPAVSIVADERTNTLIVTGTAEQIAMIEELIPKLDRPVEQVKVQVRIQEVTRSTLNNLGIQWETSGGSLVAVLADAGLSLIFDATRSLAALNIKATLNALEKQGLSRRVNDSNITVLNNQTGKIHSGYTFMIPITDNEGKQTLQQQDAGVTVEVTPQVTNSGEIILDISASVSSILERNPVQGYIDKLSKQETHTVLRVRDGDTVVLGGLIKNSFSRSKQGIPLLSDIPIIGALFSQTSQEREDSELIIVIRATRVLEGGEVCVGPLQNPCEVKEAPEPEAQ